MKPVLFQIGSFQVYSFGFMIAVGVLVGLYFALREAKRKGIDTEMLYNLAMGLVISGILGARIFYILVYNLDYYIQNPAEIIMLQHGGLSIHGGLLGGFIFGAWFIRKHKLNFWVLADTVAPAIALGTAIGRVGCDVFGVPMSKPWFWGVNVKGQVLHPTQLYEFVLDYFIFFLLWRFRQRTRFDGQLFLIYIALYAAARGIVEFFRYNPTVGGVISVAHLASLVFIMAAAVVYFWLGRSGNKQLSVKDRGLTLQTSALDLFWVQLSLVLLAIAVSVAIYYGLGYGPVEAI